MLRNMDDSDSSQSSQTELDLYNVRNNYTEKLNQVRKQLNMLELSEEKQKCTITEITEEPGVSKQKKSESKAKSPTTPRPCSVVYNLASGSSTNVLEPDYSPPKKKVCQRLKTPRFTSVSESSVPYTKGDSNYQCLKAQPKPQGFSIPKEELMDTKCIQCNEEELKLDLSRYSEEENKSKSSEQASTQCTTEEESDRSAVPFPNVIIKTQSDKSSVSSVSSTKLSTTTSSSQKVLPLNAAEGSSDEEILPVRRLSTIVSIQSSTRKMRFSRQNKVSSRTTMFEDVNRLRSGTDKVENESSGCGDSTNAYHRANVGKTADSVSLGDLVRRDSDFDVPGDGRSKFSQYVQQYMRYKKDVEKNRSPKRRSRHTVIAKKVVNIEKRHMDPLNKLYKSETSLVSDEEKCNRGGSTERSEEKPKRTFWERLCWCLWPRGDARE